MRHAMFTKVQVIIVGVPYSESGLMHMGDITGGTPYGATPLAGQTVHANRAKTS
jgi:NAD(P)H dehydrogenase (quinone)